MGGTRPMDGAKGKKKSNSVVARRSRQPFFSAREVPPPPPPLGAARPHWSHFFITQKKKETLPVRA